MDAYQSRYLDHQAKKKRQLTESEGEKGKPYTNTERKVLTSLLARRRSQRVFTSEPIEDGVRQRILDSAASAPNSCNRHGLGLKVVTDRREKELLSGLLIGGIGWIHRADTIVLFLADPDAYKSPNEKDFMHYCDVGFTAMAMWLTAETYNVGAAYINPNIAHTDVFQAKFAHERIFCGALVLGRYEQGKRALQAKLPATGDIII